MFESILYDQIKAERTNSCQSFLKEYGIEEDELKKVIGLDNELKEVLLTSSLVHGLANRTSDVDLILVTSSNKITSKAATQVFNNGKHFETISFLSEDLEEVFLRLNEISGFTDHELLKAFSNWDATEKIPKKYTERIVNGVNLKWELPFFEHIPNLARIWKIHSFNNFRQCVACAILAIRAEELNSAKGYIVNGLLYIMDSIMSHFGFVFSNKKWFLQRWEHHKKYHIDMPLYREVSSLWIRAVKALSSNNNPNNVEHLYSLYRNCIEVLNVAIENRDLNPIAIKKDYLNKNPFIRESNLLINDSGNTSVVALRNLTENEIEMIPFSEFYNLSKEDAKVILCLLRSRVAKIFL